MLLCKNSVCEKHYVNSGIEFISCCVNIRLSIQFFAMHLFFPVGGSTYKCGQIRFITDNSGSANFVRYNRGFVITGLYLYNVFVITEMEKSFLWKRWTLISTKPKAVYGEKNV